MAFSGLKLSILTINQEFNGLKMDTINYFRQRFMATYNGFIILMSFSWQINGILMAFICSSENTSYIFNVFLHTPPPTSLYFKYIYCSLHPLSPLVSSSYCSCTLQLITVYISKYFPFTYQGGHKKS